MSNKSKSGKRVNILDIRKIDTKNGKKAVVQFAKGIEIFFNGEKIDLGQYGTVFIKTKEELEKDIEFLVSKEYINEEEGQTRKDRLDEKQITGSVQAVVE